MEGLLERGESLDLKELQVGSRVVVLAGTDPSDTYRYDFLVCEPGEKPKCLFMQTAPDGELSPVADVILEGTGNWTTREQNPVQKQATAMSIFHGGMSLGGYAMILDPHAEWPIGRNGRYQLMPRVSSIEVLPSIVEPAKKPRKKSAKKVT